MTDPFIAPWFLFTLTIFLRHYPSASTLTSLNHFTLLLAGFPSVLRKMLEGSLLNDSLELETARNGEGRAVSLCVPRTLLFGHGGSV